MQVCWHLLVKELEQFFLLILVMSASLNVHLASKVFELVTTCFVSEYVYDYQVYFALPTQY
jgi:HrpA-like RNA helicase